MNTRIENIFENLDVSEACLEEILEKVFESVSVERREKLLNAIQKAQDGKYRTKALKVLGKVQNKINSEQNKNREDDKKSGITFTNKMLK